MLELHILSMFVRCVEVAEPAEQPQALPLRQGEPLLVVAAVPAVPALEARQLLKGAAAAAVLRVTPATAAQVVLT